MVPTEEPPLVEAPLAAGIDHDVYRVEIRPVADNIRAALIKDLD